MANDIYTAEEQSLNMVAGSTADGETREYPASFGQQRLWIVDRLKPEHSLYNITLVADLIGSLNMTALEASFAEIVRRHDGMRTRFRLRRGRVMQEVHQTLRSNMAVFDLRYVQTKDQARTADQICSEIAERPFNLERLPLFSLSVISAGPRHHILVFSVHHIIFDNWSQEIVVREFALLYDAYANGKQMRLQTPMQYTAFSERQREKLQGAALDRLVAFWGDELKSPELFPEHVLPFRKGVDSEMRFAGRTIMRQLSEDRLIPLRRLARSQGKSLFSISLAAFMTTVYRYSRSENILVTVPVSGRNRAEFQSVVGFMVNLLPVRVQINGGSSFQAVVDGVADRFLSALENQDLPFDKMVEMFEPQRYYGGGRLSQVVFGHRRIARSSFEIGGLEVVPRDIVGSNARFELSAMVVEYENKLDVGIEYNSACFSDTHIEYFLKNYIDTLIDVSRESDRAIKFGPKISSPEFDLQCIAWNGCEEVGASWFGGVLSSIDLIPGDCVAVTCGSSSLSYGALLDRSARVAGWLRGEGLAGSDRLIGVLVERTVESVVALLGVLQSGSAYVALPAEGPKERLEELIRVAELTSVLVSGEEVERRKLELGGLCRVIVVDEGVQGARPWRGVVERDALAYVLFTSGSTGRPKGVMVSHGNLLASTQARQGYYGEAVERFLMLSPFFFDSSVAGLYWTLCSGGCVVLPEEGEQRDGARLAEICADESITHLLCIPSLYEVLLGSLDEGSCLKVAIVAGETCGSKLVREHESKLAGVRLCNEYGPTEGTVWSTVSCGEVLGGGEGTVPIGRAVGTLRAYIEDEVGELLPLGAQGEIVVGGSGVARGYWKQPGATAEKFVADGLSGKAGQRCYRTGDKGRWSGDGQIVFEGRMDDEVKVRGHRVSLGEIESVLMRHEAVAEAAAVQQGEGGSLLAFAVLRPGREIEGAVLREYLRQYLPQAVVPGQTRMVTELPKLPNGKLNRHRLLVMAQEKVSQSRDQEYMDPVESLIADVWSEVLGRESVRAEDNFFEVGGHSLLATQVLNRMHSLFDRSVMLRTFFEHPTLRGLANEIKRAQLSFSFQSGSTAIRTRAACERSPLSFQQQRLWFLYEMDRFSTDYHLPRALRLRGKLSVEQIDRTLREIIRRHEVLRTTFTAEDGRPYMVVNKASAWQFSIQPIDGITADEKLKEIVLRINDEIRRPFVLEKEAFRFILYQIDNDDQVLFINMHHIVTDGWSLGLLMKELRILLTDFQHGRNNTLPELPFQYGDFAAWQRDWLQGSVLEGYIDHWQRELEDAPTASQLLLREDTTRIPFAGRSLLSHTGPELADSLRKFCRDSGNTLYIVLESLFAVSVAWHSGVSDIVIGTSVANRRDPRSESLIGFFSNTIPIRTRIDPDCTYRSLLQRAKRTILRAFSLEDVPMESVVSRLRRSGSLGRQEALFDTFFVLHNEPIQTLSIPGLHAEFIDIHNPTTMFKLSASISEESEGLLCMLHYDANYLSEEMVLTIERTFERLLAASVAAPDDLVLNTLADDPGAFIPHFSMV